MKYTAAFSHLCTECGIAATYVDIWGHWHRVSNPNRRALLEAMGISVRDEADILAAIAAREAGPWRRVLPPVQVVRAGKAATVPCVLPPDEARGRLRWVVELENGERMEGALAVADLAVLDRRELDDARQQRLELKLPPALPLGYHRLELWRKARLASMALIVAPPVCYQPPSLAAGEKVWGISLQLYALRSARNWGIGDLADLLTALDVAARLGAHVVGISPLHALCPGDISPYTPSSREFINVLFMAVDAMPDYAEAEPVAAATQTAEFQARLRALRASEQVEYDKVAAIKLEVLEQLYVHFRERHLAADTPRSQAFRAFQAAGGRALRRFALFEALQRDFAARTPPLRTWQEWPVPCRDPASPEVSAYEQEHLAQVEFHEYLQWQAEEQLRAAHERARELKLDVGLYHDLAVGANPAGAEVWANQSAYAARATIGAPPDHFNPRGQNWGLAPFLPDALVEAGYAPFVAVLRANMRHAGALRLDHVMALMRLFWVPPGHTAESGAYVSYPLADLMGILALESQRNRCLVVGEDLGTVPDAVRDALDASGILSYRILWFERDEDGAFRAPPDYPAEALAAVSTHDLATLAGFWVAADLDLRSQLGLFPTEALRQEEVIARARDRMQLLVALERDGLLPAGAVVQGVSMSEMTQELVLAVHVYLARSSAKIMLVQPEDILGQRAQANLPGAQDASYPNWRGKLALNLEQWFEDTRMGSMAEALNAERGTAAAQKPAAPAAALLSRIPVATYRLQINSAFTMREAAEVVPYLHALGISHCYLSPLLRARPGSAHGYDIVDHSSFNPEVGSGADFERFFAALREHDMGLILDIVPNHMGVMGSDNAQWLDVLENGAASRYQGWFDMDWVAEEPNKEGKLLVPVLGDHYGTVLESGQLHLAFDSAAGEFSIWYGVHRLPVDPREYPLILNRGVERLSARMGESLDLLEFQSVVTAFSHLPPRNDTTPEAIAERARDKETLKRYLSALCARSQDIAWFVGEVVEELNGRPGDGPSFDGLHALIEAQAYRPAFWRVAADEINYRRFFDINDLAGLRQEDPEVFAATHKLVGDLLAAGLIDGLRIDHVDGLQDPAAYLRKLQALHGAADNAAEGGAGPPEKPIYMVVEKILCGDERLRVTWPVHGTTGYEFSGLVNGLFVDPEAEAELNRLYISFTGEAAAFDEVLRVSKRLIAQVSLSSELNILAHQLRRIARADRHTRDYTINGLRAALQEVTACMPVYRTYITAAGASPEDQRFVRRAVDIAKANTRAADLTVFEFLHDAITGALARGRDDDLGRLVFSFAMRFQQFSAPAMAKGMEDTSLYRFHRLISLNDVGSDPRRFATSVAAFHRENRIRLRRWPNAMLNTTTHDSKRSEDVRARINVLSELPDEWRLRVRAWSRYNSGRKRMVDGLPAPDANDEYLLYQILLGSWPATQPDQDGPPLGRTRHDEAAQGEADGPGPERRESARTGLTPFRERIEAYMLKAVREAKRHSSWINPNADYEDALLGFIRSILDTRRGRRFRADFIPFQRRIARWGMYNSVSQTLLKLTAPGVPDFYQGSELWDLRLVDPDNRGVVDFRARARTLARLAEAPAGTATARRLLDAMDDGAIKLYVIWKALALRRRWPSLFSMGQYLPLRTGGRHAAHLCAFARTLDGRFVVTVVPRLLAALDASPPLGEAWSDTWLELPAGGRWSSAFTGQVIATQERDGAHVLPLVRVFADFPCALLVPEADAGSGD